MGQIHGPQFFKVEIFARRGRQGRPGLKGVIGEAERRPGFATHVTLPRPPTVLFGSAPADVIGVIDKRLAGARDRLGRSLPSTTGVMLAGVVSWPIEVLRVEADPDAMQACNFWEGRVTEVLKHRFRDSLVSIVAHRDETYPHVHFWVVPKPDAFGRFDLEKEFSPLRAQGEARRAGKDRKAQRRAYCAEAVKEQNWFYEMVGSVCGLTRFGPKRPRRTKTEQIKAAAAERVRKAEQEVASYKVRAQEARRRVLEHLTSVRQNAEATVARAHAESNRAITDIVRKANDEIARRAAMAGERLAAERAWSSQALVVRDETIAAQAHEIQALQAEIERLRTAIANDAIATDYAGRSWSP